MIRLHWMLVAFCALLILVVPTGYRLFGHSKYRWLIFGGWLVVLIALALLSKYVRRALVLAARPRDLLGKAEAVSETPSFAGTLLAGLSAFVLGSFILVILAAALWSIVQAILYKKHDKRAPARTESVLHLTAVPAMPDRSRLPPPT